MFCQCPLLAKLNVVLIGKGKFSKVPIPFLQRQWRVNMELRDSNWHIIYILATAQLYYPGFFPQVTRPITWSVPLLKYLLATSNLIRPNGIPYSHSPLQISSSFHLLCFRKWHHHSPSQRKAERHLWLPSWPYLLLAIHHQILGSIFKTYLENILKFTYLDHHHLSPCIIQRPLGLICSLINPLA